MDDLKWGGCKSGGAKKLLGFRPSIRAMMYYPVRSVRFGSTIIFSWIARFYLRLKKCSDRFNSCLGVLPFLQRHTYSLDPRCLFPVGPLNPVCHLSAWPSARISAPGPITIAITFLFCVTTLSEMVAARNSRCPGFSVFTHMVLKFLKHLQLGRQKML